MGYNKDNLGEGEKIVYVTHKHVIVLFKAAIQWIIVFLLAIVAAFLISAQAWDATLKNILLVVMLVAAFVSFIAFGVSYLVWQAEQYIITNERVIQVEGIINKQEFTTSLDKINDIQTNQSLFGRMLGYGNVELITGSDVGINKLDYLDKPFDFKKIMLNAKNKYYGDASDAAPLPPHPGRRYDDNEDNYQPRPRDYGIQAKGQAYPPRQDAYADPRGYTPPQPYPPNANFGQPRQSQAPLTPQQIADSIQQLARLRDNGIISEAEFQAKKTELMNRL